MVCLNCGKENDNNSNVCIGCGTILGVNTNQNINQQSYLNSNVQFNEQPVYNSVQNNISSSDDDFNLISYIMSSIVKPCDSYKENSEALKNSKNSIIFCLIITSIMTILTIVKTIITTVRKVSYYSDEVKWEWDNLKELNFVNLIGKTFLIYALIIFAVAFVFYLGSLVIKKDVGLSKMLSIVTTSIIPLLLGILIVMPIASMIYEPLGIILALTCSIYSFMTFYVLTNEELKLEGNTHIYFYTICCSVLSAGAYFAIMKTMESMFESLF